MLTKSSLSRSASCWAASNTRRKRGETYTCCGVWLRAKPFERASRGAGSTCAGRDADLVEHSRHDARVLLDQRAEQVLGLELGVVALLGLALRGDDGLLRFFGQFVHVHAASAPLTFARGECGAQRAALRPASPSIVASSSRMWSVSRMMTSTPARLTPISSVSRRIWRTRSRSYSEYRRMRPFERAGSTQPGALVVAQRLLVDADQPRRHADHERRVGRQAGSGR